MGSGGLRSKADTGVVWQRVEINGSGIVRDFRSRKRVGSREECGGWGGSEVVIVREGCCIDLSIYLFKQTVGIKSPVKLQNTESRIFRISFWIADSKAW